MVNYGYDSIGQLTSAYGLEPDGVTPRGNENFGYGYDPANNLLLRTNNTLIQTFTTDGANQLVTIARNNDLLTVAGSLAVSNAFSINGQDASIYQDLTFAVTNGVLLANGFNVLTALAFTNGLTMTNQTAEFLPTAVALGYDANGNLTDDRLHAYDYDCANELTRITVTNIVKAELVYDGFGRKRIRKEFTWTTNSWTETNEIHYVYDGMSVLQERASNNTPLVTYTRGTDLSGSMDGAGGIGGLLARSDANGNSAFYHADGNGNITMLTSNNGVILAKYLYDPFGNTLGAWGPLATANSYRFSSKEFEPISGTYSYGYRFYEPNLQRWMSRDPIQEEGGINLYEFVRNNTPNHLDFFGLVAEEEGKDKLEPENNPAYGWFGLDTPFSFGENNGFDEPIGCGGNEGFSEGRANYEGDPEEGLAEDFWMTSGRVKNPRIPIFRKPDYYPQNKALIQCLSLFDKNKEQREDSEKAMEAAKDRQEREEAEKDGVVPMLIDGNRPPKSDGKYPLPLYIPPTMEFFKSYHYQ